MIADCRFRIRNCRLSIVDCRLRRDSNYQITKLPNYQIKRAFTLVEMVIVIAIIILLAGLVLPAASQMWRERKLADAQNMISGMLMVARARALEGNAGESGLFFYLDDQNVQHVAAISQDPGDGTNGWQTELRWHNVFTVSPSRNYAIPAPMRVVPRYAVCTKTPQTCEGYDADHEIFDPNELANNNYLAASTDQPGQRHRNFFTVVYSSSGELQVGRDVVIRDLDEIATLGETGPLGDITGLRVAGEAVAAVLRYKTWKDHSDATIDIPSDPLLKKPFEAVGVDDDDNTVAMNFPSVDGLLVYDDSLFNEAGDVTAKRKYLVESAQPFYIHRLTGAVVRGPVGEGPATP